MPTDNVRTLTLLASLAWLVVGGYGLWGILVEDSGDDWQIPYLIFGIALMVGAALSVAAVWSVSRRDERSPTRLIGLGFCVVGVLSTLVAWALPLWMTLLAIGYAFVAAFGAAAVATRGGVACRRSTARHGGDVHRDRR